MHEANEAIGENGVPILTRIEHLANVAKIKQLQMKIENMKKINGGNKRKKTKKVKRTKRQNKKTRVVKQRGGENKDFDAIVKNLPFRMTITKAIDGTQDIPRDPLIKRIDCICEPDAYQSPLKTLECAKKGQDDSRGFAMRHLGERGYRDREEPVKDKYLITN